MPHSRMRALGRGIIAGVFIIILVLGVGGAYFLGNQQASTLTVVSTSYSTINASQTSTSAGGNVIRVFIPDDAGYPYAQVHPTGHRGRDRGEQHCNLDK